MIQKVEALIFASKHALNAVEIKSSIEHAEQISLKEKDVSFCIDALVEKYASDDFAFHLIAISGGYKFVTKVNYHSLVVSHLKNEAKKRLTKAAIETLSIIAYKQPVSRTDIESIRGVNCEYSLHKLLEKDLVEISGRDPGPGRPLNYKTTDRFMDYFGIESLKDLPRMAEIKSIDHQMGEQAPIEESVEEEGITNVEI